MKFKKGQAALDFLMTYGWAIALVVIIAAVLFALGIFDVSNFVGSRSAGFSGVSVTGWSLMPNGDFTMRVSNQVGQPINVTNVSVRIGQTTLSPTNWTGERLNTGQISNPITITGFGTQTAGTGYTATASITYIDLNSGFSYTSTGTLTGRVVAG
ncbi:MAG: hypothetical protein N3G22_03720 [Candidatus Micrarchaeota archaeon]|nr:hypothetical protein [Candidatus Micrarchaeota archaeon]